MMGLQNAFRCGGIAVGVFSLLLGVPDSAADAKGALPIEVTTVNDVEDGNSSSVAALLESPGPDGAISLREAITAANNTTGGEVITFSTAGDYVISTALPNLDDASGPIEIRGEGKPVLINGTGIAGTDGLMVVAPNNTISGLSIRGFQAAIRIAGVNGNVVTRCILGNDGSVESDNPAESANQYGVVLGSGASFNSIGDSTGTGGNVISGNSLAGVLITLDSNSNTIYDNYIGTNATGESPVPNGIGILIDGGKNTTIGMSSGVGGNLISGNTGAGIEIRGNASNNMISSNIIGESIITRAPLPNGQGIYVDGTGGAGNNIIGSTTYSGRNLIGHNVNEGIVLFATSGNQILGNTIGTSTVLFNGTSNGASGILILGGSTDNSIGNGNFDGENQIAYNEGDGILIDGSANKFNAIRSNTFFQNGGLGIRLANGAQEGILPPTFEPLILNGPVSGSTVPNGTVEIYYGAAEEGQYQFEQLVADSDGLFTTMGTLYTTTTDTLVATVTDLAGNTSAFSAPVTVPLVFTADPDQLLTLFLFADDDGDGRLSLTEFSTSTGRDTETFNTADLDSNGLVTFFELLDFSLSENDIMRLQVDTLADLADAPDASTISALLNDPGSDGKISLREALLAVQMAGDMEIDVTVNGTILLTSPLPALPETTSRLFIRGNGGVTLDGRNLTNGASGIVINTDSVMVEGFHIVNFPGSGILISGPSSYGSVVLACHLGTDGTVAAGNGVAGISLEDGAGSNTIGGTIGDLRNIISGNPIGIAITGPNTSFNTIYNNYIGLDASGTRALPNTVNGVQISGDVRYTAFLGLEPNGTGLLISGNGDGSGDGGVSVDSAIATYMFGCGIGIDANGAPLLGNNPHGIRLSNGASNSLIGLVSLDELANFGQDVKQSLSGFSRNKGEGFSPLIFELNRIAGNVGDGIQLDGLTTRANGFFGNSIYRNGGDAIRLLNGANNGIVPPTITEVTATSVSGSSVANALVLIHGDDEDEAEFVLGATNADATGQWTFEIGKGASPTFQNYTALQVDSVAGSTSALSEPVPTLGGGNEGEGEGEGECTDTETDSDGDGVSDCEELALGTNPAKPDTDDDGMSDGFEVTFGLNPLSPMGQTDSLLDSDGDGLSNLEEFLRNTNPMDANDPGKALYVDPATGADTVENGSADNPFRTLGFALGSVGAGAGASERIILAAGNYDEDVALASNVTVTGPVIDGAKGGAETAVLLGTVTGADGAILQDVDIVTSANTGTLLNLNSPNMIIRRVRFFGVESDRGVTGILAQGSAARSGLVDSCDFVDMGIAIDITGGMPTIRKSMFIDPSVAGIYVRSTASIDAEGGLSSATNSASGFNTFTFDPDGSNPVENPVAVINETNDVLRMENNDWGTDDDNEVDALISGAGDFLPKLARGSAVLASSLFCTLFDNNDQKRLLTAAVTLQGSGYAPVTQNEAGVYAFPAVLAGGYDVICSMPGYKNANLGVSVGAGEIKSVVVPMGAELAGEGEGEGEGEGGGGGGKEPGMVCAPTTPAGASLFSDLLLMAGVLALLVLAGRCSTRRRGGDREDTIQG